MCDDKLGTLAGNDVVPEEGTVTEKNVELPQLPLENGLPERDDSVFAHIALSLARGYTDLYYVNMDTDEFIEFHTDDDFGVLTEARRGADFFEGCGRDAKLFVHPDDQAAFVEAMDRDFLEDALEQTHIFELVYRRIKGGEPFYVRMRVSRMEDDDRIVVIAVADVDEQIKRRRAEERMIEERIVYARLHALTGNFICVYVVDPETGSYHEFSATDGYEASFAQAKEGVDFFATVRKAAQIFTHPNDMNRFFSVFTKENVMAEVERSGIFTLGYRLMMEGKPTHVQLKAAMVEEKEGRRLVVGINDVDAQVRQEEETGRRLVQAQRQANIDALTGIKNKHAYLEAEARINCEIAQQSQPPFAVSVLDVNDLKKVNDTDGHRAGDQLIRDACKIICDIFKHSPVFRIGGDEFAVISQGNDYARIDDLLVKVSEHNEGASQTEGVVIACGMARFDNDACLAAVFERADQNMYENKSAIKSTHTGAPARAEKKYVFSEETRSALESLRQPFAVFQSIDGEVCTLLVSDGFCNLFGYENNAEGVFGMNRDLLNGIHPDDAPRVANVVTRFATEGGKYEVTYRSQKKEEPGHFVVHAMGEHVYTDDGTRLAHVWYTNEGSYTKSGSGTANTLGNALGGSYFADFDHYSAELQEEAAMKHYIIESFDTAIRERWIEPYFQPIIRSVNEKACDVEALARWIDPDKGVLSPACFIPALEESGLIYKLDLYILERVLEYIKAKMDAGFFVIPHSINLSRVDFDACDIVEEIRKRVDAAGIDRDRITIEITESVIGSDFDFMKEQVKRFRDLGFPVWMDDFGSGYSSLDVLQSIKFDLIKFDMGFMRKLDENEDGQIILTELMRMATSLGLNTICEGVETESQVRFLQEIGCSKLQGFYFSEPLSFDAIQQKLGENALIKHENPEEADYYESIGRVNLYDLGVIAQDEKGPIRNTFNTLPMGIIEIRGDSTRFVRSNQSYRDFINRFFGLKLSRLGTGFAKYDAAFMQNVVKTCCEQGLRSFYDEKMSDGSIVHSFARRIGSNPVTGDMAVVCAVLSITEPDETTSYADIARALAADYYNIYVVDLDTNNYVEYSSLVGDEELALERHGADFFESAKRDVMTRLFESDREPFLSLFSKESVIRELDTHGVFTANYRLIDTGEPMYVSMKITRMKDSNRIILGVSNIDAQMKKQEEEARLQQERVALGRIAALSANYIVLYTVDPATGHYTQYSPSNEFEKFELAKQGEDFFADVVLDAPKAIDPRDMERHLRALTKENMMGSIRESGSFVHNYRLLIDGKPVPVTLKAVPIEEADGKKILLGVSVAD